MLQRMCVYFWVNVTKKIMLLSVDVIFVKNNYYEAVML